MVYFRGFSRKKEEKTFNSIHEDIDKKQDKNIINEDEENKIKEEIKLNNGFSRFNPFRVKLNINTIQKTVHEDVEKAYSKTGHNTISKRNNTDKIRRHRTTTAINDKKTNYKFKQTQSTGTPNTSNESIVSYDGIVEPARPPPGPRGLLKTTVKNVQMKMKTLLETYEEPILDGDGNVIGSYYISKKALIADRLIIYLGDSDGSPAGIWSSKLCKRSGTEGGGIHNGSLGSMLPYLYNTKESKMGMIIYDDLFQGEPDMFDEALNRYITVWRDCVSKAKATHVFIIAYGNGGRIVVEGLRRYFSIFQRQLSGIGFICSLHQIEPTTDSFAIRKLLAQWTVHYIPSDKPLGTRIIKKDKLNHDHKNIEEIYGCICLSGGKKEPINDIIQIILPCIFATFKARWSGFRVTNVSSGLEKSCYHCNKDFTLRRWRRHCRTCQNPVCERCSSLETTVYEGQVRLCITCKNLPSLVQWSRPRAVRTGEKLSVFSDSVIPGKLSIVDFELLSIIGKGACGKVLLVQKKEGNDANILYAMKVLKKEWVLNKDLVTQTMAERRILKEANHPFIVQLRYAFQNHDKLYMVMDYYHGGSLRQVLRKKKRFSIKRATFYLAEVFLAISHLHSKNIIYRDLKLENIVVCKEGHVACTDFGLSKEDMDKNDKTKSFVGTCEYLAPELIKKTGYGRAVDWWAFGILAFEMIQGDAPFRHQTPLLLFEKIIKDEPIFTDRFTKHSIDLIKRLLKKNPDKRLGCGINGEEDIRNHPFFKNINFTDIFNKESYLLPKAPHKMEDITSEEHLNQAISKLRDAREELMPDSPVALPSSPSEKTHFPRFSYAPNAKYDVPNDEEDYESENDDKDQDEEEQKDESDGDYEEIEQNNEDYDDDDDYVYENY